MGSKRDWQRDLKDFSAVGYAFEQFNGAVRTLALGKEPLLERLRQAWSYRIMHVREEDISDIELHERIAAIKDRLQPDGGELTDTQQSQLAEDIISAYTEITEQLALLSSPR